MTSPPRYPLAEAVSAANPADPDDLLTHFLGYCADLGFELYPAQEEALLEIMAGKHVILNTPTGSGKSLVASALIFRTLVHGGRAFYTCPIKALVSEKFFALCDDFGPSEVGMMTGDATINRDAPIICCTAEILSNMALREGEDALVDAVVMDEFHYYGDRDRGIAWQIPLLVLKRAMFMLMSATLGDCRFFVQELEGLTGRSAAWIKSVERPVPLSFEYSEIPLLETIKKLVEKNRAPIYIVNFTQRACAEEAQNLMSENFSTKEQKAEIHAELKDVRFDSPYGKEIQKFIRHGVGIHHAGLLPKYRLLVEKLAQKGLLKIICGTDTLGVGVNVPIRTVLFTRLCKFDGQKTGILGVREFHQIAGRAGRKGFDSEGLVVVQAPAHVIENIRIDEKKSQDPKRYKKLQRAKPPNKGYVHYDRTTFDRLVESQPEALEGQFSVSHGMLINLLARPNEPRGYRAFLKTLERAHLSAREARQQKKRGATQFRELIGAGILSLTRRDDGRRGSWVELQADLQDDFSLNQTLSLFLLEVLDVLDPEDDGYALDLLSFVESILEDPHAVLYKLLDKKKGDLIAELKAQGVEYDDRMEQLEKVEIDKPNAELIYETFNAFAKQHPWVREENVRPKSVVRDMFENYRSFDETVRHYGMQRMEGVLLRYLSDAYKTMLQTVPSARVTVEVDEIIDFLRFEIRDVDASLLDEWETRAYGAPTSVVREADVAEPLSFADQLAKDRHALLVRVRRELHRFVRALALRDYESALRCLRPRDHAWTADALAETMAPYYEEHTEILVHHKARQAEHTRLVEAGPRRFEATQTLVDPDEHNDWSVQVVVQLDDAIEEDQPLLELVQITG